MFKVCVVLLTNAKHVLIDSLNKFFLAIKKTAFTKTFVCPSSKCSFLFLHQVGHHSLQAGGNFLNQIFGTYHSMSDRRTIFHMNLPEIAGQQ